MEPMEVDGYSDLVEIGEGGFAVVYRARRERLDQEVALKVLKPSALDQRELGRFEAECRVMGSLTWHPHVVSVFDSGLTSDGRPYLTMEYFEAGSLADRLRREGPMPWAETIEVGVQVSSALGAVHDAGRVHRDVKPENLLLGTWGEVKLADFGIARALEPTHQSTTVSFTAHYVAPEVLRGHRGDQRSDVYSLAATLHTLIAGRPPFFLGDDEPIATVLLRIVSASPPRLDHVPDGLADLLQRCLDKDVAVRCQTAVELGRELQSLQVATGLQPTSLRVAPGPTRSVVTTPATADSTSRTADHGSPAGPSDDTTIRLGADPRPTLVSPHPQAERSRGSEPPAGPVPAPGDLSEPASVTPGATGPERAVPTGSTTSVSLLRLHWLVRILLASGALLVLWGLTLPWYGDRSDNVSGLDAGFGIVTAFVAFAFLSAGLLGRIPVYSVPDRRRMFAVTVAIAVVLCGLVPALLLLTNAGLDDLGRRYTTFAGVTKPWGLISPWLGVAPLTAGVIGATSQVLRRRSG